MPFVLSDQKVCHPVVPLAWKPVLEALTEFVQLEQQLREQPDNQSLIQRIQSSHDQLVAGSNDLLEPHALDDLSEQHIEKLFAQSVFLLMRIAQAVAGDDKVLDTAGCRMLSLYESDFLATDRNRDHLREVLADCLSLDADDLDRVEALVERDAEQATRKHAIVRAIRDLFCLWETDRNAEALRENAFLFFDAVHPDAGLVAEEVDVIVTGTMIFFCLPFKGDELTTERFQQLSAEKQQPLRDFLKRVNRFSQWQFAHFPVFGFRRGEDLEPALLDEISSRSGVSRDDVIRELSTLTAVIPVTEVDKYVVHDIWGHSWQACMLGFDDLYTQLASYADPLALDEFAIGPRGAETAGFADCFTGSGASLKLDEEQFRRFVELEVAERLPVAMTPVLAEVLADVAEFKLLATGRTGDMANSSALNTFPAKLDLTMRDVIYYFRQATKVFRLWATREDRLERTVEELITNRGATKAAATKAVHRAAEIWSELESDRFAPEIRFHEESGDFHVNVVARLALNFLAIHRETLTVYDQIGAMDTGTLPLRGLRDLMLISVAVFFEDAPTKNLWRVDEFLKLRIEPLCEALVSHAR